SAFPYGGAVLNFQSSRRKPRSIPQPRETRNRGSRVSPGRQLWAVIAAVLLWIPIAAFAAAPTPVPLTPQDTLELQRIAAYLNGIRTMTARFQQYASNGVSSGEVWVSRPGRMRFEYDAPTSITLLADSENV